MSKTGFAMFLAGATVGAAATWLCLRQYYEQIAQEEIDSVKAAFAERKPVNTNIAKNEKSNEKQEENQHKADIAKLKPDLVNYAAKLQEEGYTNYTEHSKKNTEEKKDDPITSPHKVWMTPLDILRCTIEMLNAYRESYLETKDKQDWWQMIQLLPSSYNQKRTVMLNYEVLANIYKSRRNHKLDEWHTFCDWIESLPYSELITGEKKG